MKLYDIVNNSTDLSGAELTNRIIPGDEKFNYPEWLERGYYKNIPIKIYYRTTPENQADVNETGDWGCIDWIDRIDRIVIDTVKLDKLDLEVDKAEKITGLKAD